MCVPPALVTHSLSRSLFSFLHFHFSPPPKAISFNFIYVSIPLASTPDGQQMSTSFKLETLLLKLSLFFPTLTLALYRLNFVRLNKPFILHFFDWNLMNYLSEKSCCKLTFAN